MKIGIDTNIFAVDRAGTAVYAQQLIKNLLLIDTSNVYEFFSCGSPFYGSKTLKKRIENIYRDFLWGQIVLPYQISKRNVDLLHCPAFKAPLGGSIPLVVSLLDIHILRSPYDYTFGFRSYCRLMLKRIAKRADRILTLSEFSKRDIVRILSVPEEKVTVTYCGFNENFHPALDRELKSRLQKKYNLERKFILYAGAIQPRKNIPALLSAYAKLRKNNLLDHQLVFATGTGWRNREVYDLIKEIGLKEDIIFLGHVPHETDLPYIYNLAEFLVYPSFFEGFGMPVLEAMACGCPVICSNTSSLPEVAGDAAVMIDPYKQEELESAMLELGINHSLREGLREKGFNNVKRFSWEQCARQTQRVYRELLNA